MFANYLIGLREGLEAALIVSILIAYLVKMDRRDRLPMVGVGVAIAIVVSVVFGALLTFTSSSILETTASRETFGGTLSIIAVGFVTWMVFWMRNAARGMRTELNDKLATAIAIGAGAIAATAFIAVAREGLETALFFWSAVQAAGSTAEPVGGFILGLITAVVLAWLLYRRSVDLDLAKFFTWTGALLVIVAAGVLAYGVHDLQEGGVLGGLNNLAFDVSAAIPPASWYGTLLKGTVNFTAQTTVAQAVVWLLYMGIVMPLFLIGDRPTRAKKSKESDAAKQTRSTADKAKRGAVVAGVVVASALVLSACGDSNSTSASSDPNKLQVSATDTACETSTESTTSGTKTFVVRNDGSQITEVYVYGPGDKVMGEVENVGPATSRDLVVQLPAGAYQVACKPGMIGSGIRTPLKVTGE